MAHIDNLIDSVKDPELRAALKYEYGRVTKHRSFGLVFDRHQPESLLLPKVTPRIGDKVQVMTPGTRDRSCTDATGTWVVASIDREANTALLSNNEGETRSSFCGRLVVIRDFGDPVYPGLKSTGSFVRGGGELGDPGDKPFHVVLNAENHHALEALLYPYEGKVDAIYIDPPYNSGSRDWKYNNDYVDSKDPYRHSKWLSFMDRRLRLAKRLLRTDESVLICAIDENEVHRLSLLLGQIFPASKIQMVSVFINPAGASIIDQFSRIDEQVLFVHIGSARPARTRIETTPLASTGTVDEADPHTEGDAPPLSAAKPKPFQWEGFQRRGGNSRRKDTKSKFFPVYVDEANRRIIGCGDHLPAGVPRSSAPPAPDGAFEVWPIKQDGTEACWQLSDKTFRNYLAEGRIKLGRKNKKTGRWGMSFLTSGHMRAIEVGEVVVKGRDDSGALIVEYSTEIRRSQVGKTLWTAPAYNATSHGSIMLKALVPGRSFPYPKSLYAVEDALRFYLLNKPNSLVLDFFGGSGTTTQAVARLNRQDGGRRRSVLVTNNEVSPEEAEQLRSEGHVPGDPTWEALGICEHITRPRLLSAFSGTTPEGALVEGAYRFTDEFPMSEGFDENIEFFDLTYEDPGLVSLGRRFEAIAPLLWLKAGAKGRLIDVVDSETGWTAPSDSSYAILFDTSTWVEFTKEVDARSDDVENERLTHVYVVTDSLAEFQQVASRLDGSLNVTRLYSDYLRTFEINTTGRG